MKIKIQNDGLQKRLTRGYQFYEGNILETHKLSKNKRLNSPMYASQKPPTSLLKEKNLTPTFDMNLSLLPIKNSTF